MDKLPENEINVDNKIVKWFKSYWYYYKWWFIAAVFVIIVVAVCVGQTCQSAGTDMRVLYGGTYPPSGKDVPGMEDAFEAVLPDDYTNDGKKKVSMVMFHIFSDEQIKEASKDPEIMIDVNNNRQELGKFKSVAVSSQYYFCMLDPELYKLLDSLRIVVPLSEALGYTPENSVDGKAIRLSDTEFGQYFNCFKDMPETYLCIRSPGAIQESTGKGKDSHEYDSALALLKSIVEYKAPDDN